MGSHYFVGWGVGPWNCDEGNRRDALVVLERDGERLQIAGMPMRANIRPVLVDHRREALIQRLLGWCSVGVTSDLRVTLAVDAPLGWPASVVALLTSRRAPDVPEDVDLNPMLFRTTERVLLERGHRPLSPIRDMIGSQSTKAIHFLKRVGFSPAPGGVWRVVSTRTGSVYEAIETHPSIAKRSSTIRDAYRELADDPRLEAASEDDKRARADLDAALIAALVAHRFVDARETLVAPDVAFPPDEGWIWVPADAEPRTVTRSV